MTTRFRHKPRHDLRDEIPGKHTHTEPEVTSEVIQWRNEYRQTGILPKMREYITDRLEYIFDEIHPHFHEMHLIHPNPQEARDIAAISLKIRKMGWRAAQWLAVVEGLDMSINSHFYYMLYADDFMRFDLAWDLTHEFRVPEGIPLTTPSNEQHEQWQPETNLWDVEDAARHELELSAGGLASLVLKNHLPEDNKERLAIEAAEHRVATCLQLYRSGKVTLPEDIYDPIYWGRDSRIKFLDLRVGRRVGEIIDLTPDWDPDVLSYTTTQPVQNAYVDRLTFFDPFLNAGINVAIDRSEAKKLSLTVTAKDGVTKKTYTIVEVSD